MHSCAILRYYASMHLLYLPLCRSMHLSTYASMHLRLSDAAPRAPGRQCAECMTWHGARRHRGCRGIIGTRETRCALWEIEMRVAEREGWTGQRASYSKTNAAEHQRQSPSIWNSLHPSIFVIWIAACDLHFGKNSNSTLPWKVLE
jgi:hypothetical protein